MLVPVGMLFLFVLRCFIESPRIQKRLGCADSQVGVDPQWSLVLENLASECTRFTSNAKINDTVRVKEVLEAFRTAFD